MKKSKDNVWAIWSAMLAKYFFEFYLKKDSFARCNNPIETTGITFFLVFTKSIIF